LQARADERTRNLNTPDDLSQFDPLLKKINVEAASMLKWATLLATIKISLKQKSSPDGHSTKTVTTGVGPLELRTPRDRDGSFAP